MNKGLSIAVFVLGLVTTLTGAAVLVCGAFGVRARRPIQWDKH